MDHAILECARCGVHLPLKRDLATDEPETWLCANCGWQMPGILDPAARNGILANVAPAGSMIGPQAASVGILGPAAPDEA